MKVRYRPAPYLIADFNGCNRDLGVARKALQAALSVSSVNG
jgi:hypothetical protein